MVETGTLGLHRAAGGDGGLGDYGLGEAEDEDKGRKTELAVAPGPGSELGLTLDGELGELTRASGNVTLDVAGFVSVRGALSFEKSVQSVRLNDATETEPATQVAVEMLSVGGSNLQAFAGVNGGYDEDGKLVEGATGLSLGGVEFGLAMLGEKLTPEQVKANQAPRSWMALQATADEVSVVGLSDITIEADTISVEINRADEGDASLVDFAAKNLAVSTGTSAEPSSVTLDMDGSLGELTRASGNLRIDLAGFFQVSGGFAIEKRDGAVSLADLPGTPDEDESDKPVAVQQLLIGGSGVQAFAGVNGGQANALGLVLSDVDFAVAVNTERLSAQEVEDGKVARVWRSAQATGGASFTGVEGLTVSADTVTVNVNREAWDTSVVDYALTADETDDADARNTTLSVRTGPASTMTLDMDGARGQLLQVAGHLQIDAFGFLQVEGEFALEKASQVHEITLAGGSTTQARLLTLGGHDVNAFAGTGGGTEEALGLQLGGVDFALALYSDVSDETRAWTALQARADSAALVGVDGLEIRAQDLLLEINRADKEGDGVVDFGLSDPGDEASERLTALTVRTGLGSDSDIEMTMDGAQGELTRAAGLMTVNAFGFFQVSGQLAVERREAEFVLNDGVVSDDEDEAKAPTQIEADLLTIGGSGLDAFAGINGDSDDRMGLALSGVDFGLALITERLPEGSKATAREFTTLKATADGVSFVGLEGVEVGATELLVEINRGIAGTGGDPDVVVDYSAEQLEVRAGSGDEVVVLDAEGALGELTRAAGHVKLGLFGFVSLEGDVAFESATRTVKLAGGESVATDALLVGGRGVSAFVGVDGGTAQALGLELSDAEFGLALLTARVDTARTWTSFQATAGSVSYWWLDDLKATTSCFLGAIYLAGRSTIPACVHPPQVQPELNT